MPLRVFHLLFITVSILLAAGCAALGYDSYKAGGGWGHLVFAAVASFSAVVLGIYGVWFYRKMKRLKL